jgi:hypothetical protein
VEGDYAIQLIVNDSTEDSLPDQVTVQATYAPGILPDTGQTSCYDAAGTLINCVGTGQDGEYSINPPSYSSLGGTVTDDVTGLIWQQDVNPIRRWVDAGSYCESLVAGGYTDWRLPSTIQLVTLIDYSWWSPAIDFTYFPNIQTRPSPFFDSPFWAKELYNPSTGRQVDFVGGVAGYLSATASLYSRCVRTDPPPKSLTDNADGTVRDNNTALIWQQLDDNTARAWANALTYCNDLALASHTDWRLPNAKELLSIMEYTKQFPAINESYFLNTVSADYWTSTSRSTNPSDAWFVDFDWGNNYYEDKATANYVRCVR